MSSKPNPQDPRPADKLKPSGPQSATPEELLWQGTFSGKSMIGTWIILGVVTIAAAAAVLFVDYMRTTLVARNVVLIVLAVAWLVPIAQLVYRKLAHFYELTTQRLKHRDGILIRKNNRVEVIDIDDVSFNQGIIETLFNVGTIRIRSSDVSDPELILRGDRRRQASL